MSSISYAYLGRKDPSHHFRRYLDEFFGAGRELGEYGAMSSPWSYV
jgi:hypothetical protein